jgi:hypothetical protein
MVEAIVVVRKFRRLTPLREEAMGTPVRLPLMAGNASRKAQFLERL